MLVSSRNAHFHNYTIGPKWTRNRSTDTLTLSDDLPNRPILQGISLPTFPDIKTTSLSPHLMFDAPDEKVDAHNTRAAISKPDDIAKTSLRARGERAA